MGGRIDAGLLVSDEAVGQYDTREKPADYL